MFFGGVFCCGKGRLHSPIWLRKIAFFIFSFSEDNYLVLST